MGADAPTSGLDLWSSEVLLDPWEHFREIRDTAPAVYLERYEVYAVGRYGDVRGVLRDWQTFTSADGVAFNDLMNEAELGTAPGSDPPEHDAVRSAMLERLRLTEVRGLAEMVQRRADAMVAERLERGARPLGRGLGLRYVTAGVCE